MNERKSAQQQRVGGQAAHTGRRLDRFHERIDFPARHDIASLL